MNTERRRPIAKILSRYLVSEFLRIVALCLVAFIVVYLIADFSDRIDDFLKHQAPVGAIVRYFLVWTANAIFAAIGFSLLLGTA
jgi:lipopolysaccharide export LptBFGC system permease protein LptF